MTAPQNDLRRELGLFDATMINVGTMVGSGIFLVPAAIALHVPWSALTVLAWVVGGVVSLLGALCVAELSAAFPAAGGQYVYLSRAFGPVWGFLYGWAAGVVINPASIAAIAVGFASYIGFFTPLGTAGERATAAASIVALTVVNCLGVRLGARTQNVLTLAKIAALVVLISLPLLGSGGSITNFAPLVPPGVNRDLIGAFGLALVAVLWTYDGWIETTYVGSEIRDPGRNLPRSIVASTGLVAVLYVLLAASLAYVLSPVTMARSELVAADAARTVLGVGGAAFVTIAILVSTLGANNGIVLTAARIPYAMARGGHFFRRAGVVHPRLGTPVASLVMQGVWSIALVYTGSYNALATYVVFASFLFYGMSCAAVIHLRTAEPQLERPYRAWGYPVTPLVFIAFAAWLVGNTIVENPRDAAVGAALIVMGLPGYFYWTRKKK